MLKLIKIFPVLLTSWLASSHAQDVQLINATSVPEIAVNVDGQSWYPNFPQGLYTAGSATHAEKVDYQIRDPRSGKSRTLTANFAAHSRQALVIYGDFSPLTETKTKRKAETPNIKLLTIDYAYAKGESRLRYRMVNLVPDRVLQLQHDSATVEIPYEQNFAISKQPAMTTLTVKIDNEIIPVLIRQRRVLRNCDIIFYPDTNNQVRFIRFFEPNPDANSEAEETAPEE